MQFYFRFNLLKVGIKVSKRECVEHFIEGRQAWATGVLGFFLQAKGIVSTVGLTFVTMGTPFWWPKFFTNQTFQLDLKSIFIFSILFFGVLISGGFYYLRHRSRRSLDIKHMLHEFSHFLRDHQTKVIKFFHLNKLDKKNSDDAFQSYINEICARVQEYFKILVKDESVACCIRIAIDKSKNPGKHEIFYKTISRSTGLSQQREESSQDIAANEGIPRFFAETDRKGILIYNDLISASKKHAYKLTYNDDTYIEDIKTMMVAPLNAWDGKKESMIGILYVTSRQKNVFKVKHIDSIKFVADSVSNSIALTVQKYKLSGSMEGILNRKK